MANIAPSIGLLLIETRLSPETEAAQGVGTFESAYTEREPIPGVPVPEIQGSRWLPRIYGGQTEDAEVIAVRGGYSGRDGARVAYRIGDESSAKDYRAWSEPNLVTAWTAPADGVGSGIDWRIQDNTSIAVLPTHEIVVISRDGSGDAKTWRFDPQTGIWADAYDWSTGPGLGQCIGLAYDEEGERLIVWAGLGPRNGPGQLAYYSEDGGDSWSLYSRGGIDAVVTSGDAMRVATARGRAWSAFIEHVQFESQDRGISWQRIATIDDTDYSAPNVAALQDGRFLVAYRRFSDDSPCCRILPSASTKFVQAAEIEIDPTLTTVLSTPTVVVDYDGVAYAYVRTEAAIEVYRSEDGGQTWSRYTRGLFRTEAIEPEINPRLAVAAGGQIWLLVDAVNAAPPGAENSLSLLGCGGWSNVEHGVGDGGYRLTERGGYGHEIEAGAFQESILWIPCGFPSVMDWTLLSSGTGTSGLTGAHPGLEIATSAGSRLYQYTFASLQDYMAIEAIVHLEPGSTVGVLDTNCVLIASLEGDDYEYAPRIWVHATGIALYDGSTSRATATCTTTDPENPVHIRVQAMKGKASAWYRVGEGTTWTQFADEVTVTDNFASPGFPRIQFGGFSSSRDPTTSYWRMVGAMVGKDWRTGADALGATRRDPATGVRGLYFSRFVPSASAGSYPLPGVSTGEMGYLAATGGPALARERTSIPVAYTHPITNLYPAISPLPSRYWESEDDSEVRLAWDLGSRVWVGGAVGLVVIGAYPRLWVLEVDDNSTGWITAGTLDLGHDVSATVVGSTLTPASGTADLGYIGEGQLVGGYAVNGGVASLILRNSGGYWDDDPTKQRVVITVASTAGMSTGATEIVRPSGVLVAFPSAEVIRRRWRVRIPGSQVTPTGRYRAGLCAPGRLVGLGAEAGWDWQQQLQLRRSRAGDASGRDAYRKTGPPARQTSYGWTDGVALHALRGGADPVAVANGLPIGSREDVWHALWGHLVETLEGGRLPCVLLPQLGSETGVILDPLMWQYGHITSDSQGASGVLGTEGVDEILRLDSLAFKELRA